jgi:tetratricopeptide (TPR) repeat protein
MALWQGVSTGRAALLRQLMAAFTSMACVGAIAGADGITVLEPAKIYCGRVERVATEQEVRLWTTMMVVRDKVDDLRDRGEAAMAEYEAGIESVSATTLGHAGNFVQVRIFRASVGQSTLGVFQVFVPADLGPLSGGELVAIQRPTAGPQLLPYVKERLRLKSPDPESYWSSFLWTSRIYDDTCADLTGNPEQTRANNKKLISSPDTGEQTSFPSVYGRYQRAQRSLDIHDAKVQGDWPIFCSTYYDRRRYDRLTDCLDRYREVTAGLAVNSPPRLFIALMESYVALDTGMYKRAITLAKALREQKYKPTEALRVLTVASALSGKAAEAKAALEELEATPAESNATRGYKMAQLGQAYLAMGRYEKAIEALTDDWYRARTNVWGGVMLLELVALTIADKILPLPDSLKEGALKGTEKLLTGVGLAEPYAGEVQLEREFVVLHALIELGRFDEARKHFDAAFKNLSVANTTSEQLKWAFQFSLGRLHEAEGKVEQAIAAYQQAIDLIERSRRTINMEASRIGFVGDKQLVYGRLIALLMQSGQWNSAFLYVERAKSRALVDMLAARNDLHVPGATPETASMIQAQLAPPQDYAALMTVSGTRSTARNLTFVRESVERASPNWPRWSKSMPCHQRNLKN